MDRGQSQWEGDSGQSFMHKDSAVPAFSIHPETGVIVTARKFDRERQREYAVTVTATDQAAEPLIGICQINILILDENDNDPKFENLRYEYFLREDTMIGTSFLRVAAHDDDYSTNAAIAYSMSAEQPEYLRVNPVTGWVYVNQPISQRSHITREIVATDGGNRSSSVELSVTITNVKNQPPQWERDSYGVVIPENTMRDTPIVTIKAISLLGDPRVTYNLEDGMVPETNMPVRFYLTPNREDGSASNVAAVPLAAFTTVYVNVTDVNDNVPFFTSSVYEASVTEGAEAGTFVLQVSANDLDLGLNGKITYSLLKDRSGDYQYFRIDPELGAVYTEAVFDRETKGSYLLEVKSVDGWESARPGRTGSPTPALVFQRKARDTAYVRVFISDVNDNKPVFAQSVYEVSVDEDADVGFAVVTVSANDGDEGANAKLRYQITSGNTGGAFDVEPEVGTIFLAQRLDHERVKWYRLRVLASDGKWEDYAAVVVNVANKNDETPVFSVNEYYGSVTEELDGSPVFVLQVTATDPDKDADQESLRYSLHGQGAESEFVIDEVTGKIYAQRTLDREERAVWRFVVLATDEAGEGLTGFTDVIINVWDINDNAPVFTCMPDGCAGHVPENSPPDTSVMEMTATDLDDPTVGQNAVLTYRIVGNARGGVAGAGPGGGAEQFSINASTGTISVAQAGLDRERAETYLLVVEARDGGGMAGTGTATVRSSEPDAAVLELSAADADAGENAQLTFSIVGGDPEQKFYVVSHRQDRRATVRLKKRLDYERPGDQRFNLTVKVEDLDFSSLTHCLVQVEDHNDHAPVFVPHLHAPPPFREDVPVGTSVVRLAASDADSGPNREIAYSIAAETDPRGLFSVDEAGLVTVARPLDRETAAAHSLVVLATDRGSPPQTGSATVQLALLDVNDNGPEFEAAYRPVVWENTPGPQVVWLNQTSALLHAVDRDTPENGPPFSFSLPAELRHSRDFHLQDNGNGTATVTALRAFDRERQREFRLPVVMRDSGRPAGPSPARSPSPSATRTTTPTRPGRRTSTSTVNSHRGMLATTVLGKVYAPDPDDWDNKTYFVLNRRTGFLIIKENTPTGSYEFRVRVSDGVWPDVVSGVTVHVKELPDEAIYNSASIRVADVTAAEFLSRPAGGRSRLLDVRERTLDVRFAVKGAPYLRPERLHGYLAAHKQKLESFLQVNVSQVRVDECAVTDCGGSGGCSNQLSSPCHNGGVCVDSKGGYRCQCPPQFEGPECQQTKHSFHGDGYAWFPPARPCFESRVSLEFITEATDGLLLYSGPLAQLQHWDAEDFMAIELIGGTPTLKINHGSGTLVLQLPSNVRVADRRWHRLDVRSDSKEVRFTLDRCSAAAVTEMEGVGSRLTTEDHSSCEVRGSPQRGQAPEHDPGAAAGRSQREPAVHLPSAAAQALHRLHPQPGRGQPGLRPGLSRRLGEQRAGMRHDGRELRQHGVPVLRAPGVVPRRVGVLQLPVHTRYSGHQCELEVPEYSFDGRSHAHFRLSFPLSARGTRVQVLVRTRKPSGTIVSLLSKEQNEYLRLELLQGLLAVFYNLGDGDYSLTLPSHRLDDGEWHQVHLDRQDNEVTLRVNGGAGAVSHNKSFQGCMQDLRLNGRHVPLDSQAREGAALVSSQGVSVGCSSDSCRRNRCSPPFTCVDLWRVHECSARVPGGSRGPGERHGRFCARTPCAGHPCHRGTCAAHSPANFTCHCPPGYRGRRCEVALAIYRDDVGLSFSSLFAISICFLALLVLLLGIFLWTRWRSYKGLKEGVYHVSAHHDGWEDIRENVLNYDEEGGGGGPAGEGRRTLRFLAVAISHGPGAIRARRSPTLPLSRRRRRRRFLRDRRSSPPEERPPRGLGARRGDRAVVFGGAAAPRPRFSPVTETCFSCVASNAYDMAELQKSLQPSPAQSVQYGHSRGVHHHPHAHQDTTKSNASTSSSSTAATVPLAPGRRQRQRRHHLRHAAAGVPPTGPHPQGPSQAALPPRKSLSFSSQDLARYLCEIIRDADQHPEAAPFDSLQVFSTEGARRPARSAPSAPPGRRSGRTGPPSRCGTGGRDSRNSRPCTRGPRAATYDWARRSPPCTDARRSTGSFRKRLNCSPPDR
ncbi:hypothetical protein ANANG_G00109570 [Anguilla anguilla]|uniref:Neural-cadherin-like n=1 Tax=Anguilla anguilla TaxID=7936 RepID=A0A9D3MK30_ANGAN|nr:hypothetical protein ANANG_G00109570 [Anguilla anguilla]